MRSVRGNMCTICVRVSGPPPTRPAHVRSWGTQGVGVDLPGPEAGFDLADEDLEDWRQIFQTRCSCCYCCCQSGHLQTSNRCLGCRQLSGFICAFHIAAPGSSPKQSALLSFIVKFVLYLSCEKNLKKLRTDVEFVSLQMYQPFLYNFKWVKNILDRLKQCIIYSIVASPFWEKATNWLVDLN